MPDLDMKSMTAEATQVAEKVAKDVGRQIRDFYDEKKHSAMLIKDDYESMIKNRPFTSILIAFAAGVGIGALVKKSR